MAWFARLRNMFRSDDLSRDIEREMEFHLAERIDDLVAGGMPADAARQEARRRFGNYGMQKETTRARDTVAWLDSLGADLRYTIRALRAAPAFATVAVLSLGLGIGANTAIFTLVDAVVLRSLPVQHPEELVLVTGSDGDMVFTNPLWEQIRDRQDVFVSAAAYSATAFNLADGGEVRRVTADWVSGDFFQMLGVQPAVGRLLSRVDDRRGCPAVVAISYAFWNRELGGTANVIGRTLAVDGRPFSIVGVVDPAFFGVEVGRQTNIYAPLCSEAVVRGRSSQLDARSSWFLRILARPKPGLTREQVNARLASLAPGIAQATLPANFPPEAKTRYLRAPLGVQPAASGASGLRQQYHKALWILTAVVGLVLLIACANVANLLLARAATREREMAVRLALGARRGRLVRQLLTESLTLSLLGSAVGVLFATWGTRALVSLLSTSKRAVSLDLSVDHRVLSFTTLVAIATGVLFGLAPAWRARRVDPQSAMKARGRGVSSGRSQFALGKALVVAQIALSLVLVAGAGLLLSSWRRLATIDPGFRKEGVVLVLVDARSAGITDSLLPATFRQILERMRAAPGIVAASESNRTPVGGDTWNNVIQVAGYSPPTLDDALVWMNEVSDGFFTTLETPFIRGRDFDARDRRGSTSVAIVTESLARRFFGTTSALGRQFRIQGGDTYGPPVEIVGVVKDMKYERVREASPAIAFLAQGQSARRRGGVHMEVRVQGDPSAAIPMIRSMLIEMNPRFMLEFSTLDRQLAESLRLPLILATLSGFFGALALLLATIGLYGILSYAVARRRNEIGIRIALGAAQANVIRMVLGEVGRMVVAGVAIGVLLTLGTTRLVTAFLYGVTSSDPATLVLSALALAAVGCGAAALPAVRAARLDPVESLRED